MLQLFGQIFLLIVELFLLDGYIRRVEDDDIWPCLSFFKSKSKAMEERSVNLSDVEVVFVKILFGED